MEQDWGNFAVITGSSAGALTGLLFVAVSLNRERIAGHAALRAQAGQTLVLFMLPLLLSLLIVLPERSATGFGSWLIVLAAAAGLTLTAIGRGKEPVGADSEAALARLIDRVSPNLIVLLLILVAGGLELAGDDGMYWAAASSAVSLVGGVINAWLFLVR